MRLLFYPRVFVYLFAYVNCFISICLCVLFRDFAENGCVCVFMWNKVMIFHYLLKYFIFFSPFF